MKLHVFQHEPFEGLANIETWAHERQLSVTKTLFYEENPEFPLQDDYDLLVVMGGSMGTYDEDKFPWLRFEKEFLRRAIAVEKRILGVCLGSQLLAEAAGGRVFPGPAKELGWFEVCETSERSNCPAFKVLPPRFTPLHWHGDTFDLPASATVAYSSAVYPNQAFFLNERVLGIQFHLELSRRDIETLSSCCGEMPPPSSSVQSLEDIVAAEENFQSAKQLLYRFLDAWLPQS